MGNLTNLLKELATDDRKKGLLAAKKIIGMGRSVVPRLLDEIKTATPYSKQMIISVLGAMGTAAASAVPELVGMVGAKPPDNVQDPDSDLRAVAASALGKIGNEKSVPCLLGALHDNNYLCTCAALALGEIGDAGAVEPLSRVLRDRDKFWVARGAAAVALGNLGKLSKSALPFLCEALDYDCENSGEMWDIRAREAVEDAINRINNPSVKSKLEGCGYRYEMWGIY